MSSHCCGNSRSSERTCSGQSFGCKKCEAFRVGRVRQDARTAWLVTQLQTRTPPLSVGPFVDGEILLRYPYCLPCTFAPRLLRSGIWPLGVLGFWNCEGRVCG